MPPLDYLSFDLLLEAPAAGGSGDCLARAWQTALSPLIRSITQWDVDARLAITVP